MKRSTLPSLTFGFTLLFATSLNVSRDSAAFGQDTDWQQSVNQMKHLKGEELEQFQLTSTRFQALLESPNDFEMCNELTTAIARLDESGMTRPQQALRDCIGAKGLIDNGGFVYFLSASVDHGRAVESFRLVGADIAHRTLKQACERFPYGVSTKPFEDEYDISDEDGQFLAVLRTEFYESGHSTERAVADYIRANWREFSSLLPVDRSLGSILGNLILGDSDRTPKCPADDASAEEVKNWLESYSVSAWENDAGQIATLRFPHYFRACDQLLDRAGDFECLNSVDSITIAGTNITATGIRCLAGFSNLNRLELNRTTLTDEDVKSISDLRLEDFWSFSNPLGDGTLKTLSSIRGLKSVRLAKCEISDLGIAHLAQLPNLEDLSLRDNVKLEGESLLSLKELPIKDLNLSDASVTDQLADCVAAWTSLEFVDLRNTDVGDRTLAAMENCVHVGELNLLGTRVTDHGVTHIAKLASLDRLNLAETSITDKAMTSISQSQSITKLVLSNTAVTDAGFRRLMNMSQLQSLSIYGTQITPKVLPELKTLRSLEFLFLDDEIEKEAQEILKDHPNLSIY